MAPVLVEKNVLFVGVWRTPRITDELLRRIAMQKRQLKGYPSKLQITTGGLMLYVLNSSGRTGKTDLIPIQAVYDITVNRHDPLCLLSVFSDSLKRINLLVCYCINDIDASHIVEAFSQLKRSLSGEGFNFDLKRPEGKNWTLKTNNKEVVRTTVTGNSANGFNNTEDGMVTNDANSHTAFLEVDNNNITIHGTGDQTDGVTLHYHTPLFRAESSVEREELSHDGIIVYNVGIQTNGICDDDDMSSTTSHSSVALRTELMNLSHEIRNIKLILEEATGVSGAEYLRRHKLHEQNNHVRSQNTLWQRVHMNEKNNDPLLLESKHVGISSLPDHDARSYGTQTLTKKKYARKEKIHKIQSGDGTASAIRSRLKLDTSNHMYQNTVRDRQNHIQDQRTYYQQYADANAHISADTSEPTISSSKTVNIKTKTSAKAVHHNNSEDMNVVITKATIPISSKERKETKKAKTERKHHSLRLNSLTVEKPIEDVYRFVRHPRKPHLNHRNTILVYPSMVTDWNSNHHAGYTVADAGYAVHVDVPDRKSSISQKDMEIVEVEMRPTS